MNHSHLRTFLFYVGWGFTYGITLGMIAGTLIFPYFGTMYSTVWGAGMGIALGIASGALMAFYNAAAWRIPPDWSDYRRFLTPLVGGLVSLGAGGLLIATTQGFLWGAGTEGFFPFFLPSLGAAMFWGGLSSAYATSRYADWYSSIAIKQKHDVEVNETLPEKQGTVLRFVRLTFVKQWWLIGVGAIIGLGVSVWTRLNSFDIPTNFELLQAVFNGVVGGLVFAVGALLLYSLTVGLLIAFLNRIYFLEYAAYAPLPWYRRMVQITVGLFLLAATGIFAAPLLLNPSTLFSVGNLPILLLPLIVTLTGINIAHHYSAWYYAEEKTKIKGVPRLALAEQSDETMHDNAQEISRDRLLPVRTRSDE
jgi:hypothetical protein